MRFRVVFAVATIGVAGSFGVAGATAGPRIDLGARLSIPTTGAVRGAAVGDFDEDGLPDIAVLHPNGVEILRGLGSGRFVSSTSIAVTSAPTRLVAADLNHDGHVDLVLRGLSGATLTVLLGDGIGHFTGPAYYGTQPYEGSLAVADLDGDTHPDVAVTFANANIIDIFPGDGEGGFPATPTVLTIPCCVPSGAGIVARDFNGDGKTDLAIGGGEVLFLPGDGLGGFGTPVVSSSLGGQVGLTCADFDGDGVPDLATLGPAGDSTLYLLHGTGDGHFTFGPQLDPETNGWDRALTSADLNGDGRPDLVVSGHSFPVTVFLATGPMQFGAGVEYQAGFGGSSDTLAIADFDQDGRQDLMVGDDSLSEELSILRGDGLGRFAAESLLFFPSSVPDSGAADFNGDGNPDLAVLQSDGPSVTTCSGPQPGTIDCGPGMQVQVLPGMGQALFGPPVASPARCAPTALAIADFNRDGRPDVATANRGARDAAGVCYAASLSVLAGDGQGQLAPFVDLPVPDQPDDIVTGDFDEDGLPDLAVAFANAGLVAVYRLAPGPALVPAGTWTAPASPRFLAAGDLDGDGHLDLAVALASGEVAVLRGDGAGLIPPATLCAPSPGGGTGPIAIGDFDGDGRREIAATGTKSVRVMQVSSLGTSCTTSFEVAIPAGAQGLGTRDLNGDGLDDLVVADGFGHVSTVAGAPLPPSTADDLYGVNGARSVTIDDFDSDGLPDVAVSRPLGVYSWNVAVVRNITPAAAHLTLRVAGPLVTSDWQVLPGQAAGGAASTLFWSGVLGATGYDVVRGSLPAPRSVDTCVANDLPATVVDASDVPAPGDGWWFLARPLFPAGPGSYDGDGPGQVGSRDAEIAASPLACP